MFDNGVMPLDYEGVMLMLMCKVYVDAHRIVFDNGAMPLDYEGVTVW